MYKKNTHSLTYHTIYIVLKEHNTLFSYTYVKNFNTFHSKSVIKCIILRICLFAGDRILIALVYLYIECITKSKIHF